jgi:hypothetical protein
VKLTQTILDEEAYSSLQLYAKNCTDEDVKELYNYLHHVKNRIFKLSNNFLHKVANQEGFFNQFWGSLAVMIATPSVTVFLAKIAAQSYPLAPYVQQAYQNDPNIKILDTHWKLTDVHQELSNRFGGMRDRDISMPLIPVKDHYNQLKAEAFKLRERFVFKRYVKIGAPLFATACIYTGLIITAYGINALMTSLLAFEPIVDGEKKIERLDYLLTNLQSRMPSLAGSV